MTSDTENLHTNRHVAASQCGWQQSLWILVRWPPQDESHELHAPHGSRLQTLNDMNTTRIICSINHKPVKCASIALNIQNYTHTNTSHTHPYTSTYRRSRTHTHTHARTHAHTHTHTHTKYTCVRACLEGEETLHIVRHSSTFI